MDNDWDLHAVVRGCHTATTPPTALAATSVTSGTCSASSHEYLHVRPSCSSTSSSPFVPIKRDVELPDIFIDLCKPFFAPKSDPLILQTAAVSPPPALNQLSNGRLHPKRPHPKPSQVVPATSPGSAPQASRSKRRKNQFKKVCQVPAESLSSDIWAWRKYGQKPIKGSPYPRGYYRCSSSKGCLARKQVERNRSDPRMFIVTYTAEHNHPAPTNRNSLAGSTRQRPATDGEPPAASSSPSDVSNPNLPPSSSSPATSLEEEALPQSTSRGEHYDSVEDDEDGEVDLSLMALGDDFFVDLEKLINDDGGDCFLDRFPANFRLSWNISTDTAVTAAGGSRLGKGNTVC